MITILDLFFLIPLFIVGGICAYTDIKYGKIRNDYVGFGLIWTLFLYAYLSVSAVLSLPDKQNIYYVLEMALNGSLAIGIGYLMWRFRLWAAGDAKLFVFFSFLIPLKFYSDSYINYFPSFTLITNTFFLIVLFLIFEAFFYSFKKCVKIIKQPIIIKNAPWREWLSPQRVKWQIIEIAKMYLIYLAFIVAVRLAMIAVGNFFSKYVQSSDLVLFILLLFILRRFFLKTFFRNKLVMLLIIVLVIGYAGYLITQGQAGLFVSVIKTAFIFMIIILFLTKIIDWYIEKEETKKITADDLKENLIITPEEIEKISKDSKEESFEKKFGARYQDGLTKKQVEFLRNSIKENTEIKIYKTFAFAPFMLSACIITILLRGSFINFLMNLF